MTDSFKSDMACLFNSKAWFGDFDSKNSSDTAANRFDAKNRLEGVIERVRKLVDAEQAAIDMQQIELVANGHALRAMMKSGQINTVRCKKLQRRTVALKQLFQRTQVKLSRANNELQLLERQHVTISQDSLRQDVVSVLGATNQFVAMGDQQHSADYIADVLEDTTNAHINAIDSAQEADAAYDSALNGAAACETQQYEQYSRNRDSNAGMNGANTLDAMLSSLEELTGEEFGDNDEQQQHQYTTSPSSHSYPQESREKDRYTFPNTPSHNIHRSEGYRNSSTRNNNNNNNNSNSSHSANLLATWLPSQ